MPAYLDHAASTPMRPDAVEAMLPWLRDHAGNPSGAHAVARVARKAIDEARDVLAAALGAEPREVVFTSGGTEADNLAVFGVHERVGGVVVASAIEHHAVLDPVEACKGRTVPVDARGIVDLDALAVLLDELAVAGERVSLVSVMLVNNEVGTVQPLGKVAKVVRRKAPDALLHTDAVQALTWIDVAAAAAPADLVSVSAHKFGGPKGAGALVVRERAASRLAARQLGGGQERERRSGTPNVAAIAGMGRAAQIAVEERAAVCSRVERLRDRLVAGLTATVPGLVETTTATFDNQMVVDGLADNKMVVNELDDNRMVVDELANRMVVDRSRLAPGFAHVCVDGIDSESLLFLLDRAGVYASAAASCASGAVEPSPVLAAMGVPARWARGSLRLTLGWSSTEADVDAALEAVPAAVAQLRRAA